MARSDTAAIDITYRSIWRVVVVLGSLWVAYELRSLLMLVVFAALFATALHPLVRWLERHGFKRGLALFMVLFVLVAGILTALIWVGVVFAREIVQLLQDLPTLLEGYSERFEPVREITQGASDYLSKLNAVDIIQNNLNNAGAAVSLITQFFYTVGTIFFLTLYMLLEYQYLNRIVHAIVPAEHRSKAKEVIPKAVEIVGGYLRGQFLTSLLITAFGLVLFLVLGVPNALALAIFLGITDAIPMIGAMLGAAPATLLAWTVSPTAGIITLVALILYQQIESTVIGPKVYGRSLSISPLVVTVSTLAGGLLLGPAGVLLALPVAALGSFVLTRYYGIPVALEGTTSGEK